MPSVLSLAVAVLLSCTSSVSTSFVGNVEQVHDGDTLSVRTAAGLKKVRLEGIDAPEKGQPFSRVARQRLVQLVLYHEVQVTGTQIDDYGRLVARISVGGRDVSEVLVSEGFAWHFVRYSGDRR